MSNDVKLRPCLFCGGEAQVHSPPFDYTSTYIMCGNCCTKTQWFARPEAAIAAWNQRHQPERETVLAGVVAAKQKMQHCRDELNVAIETLVDAHVALTTPAPAVKPHCSTCGKNVAEVLCETCGKWWADNPPPTPAEDDDPDDHLGGKLAAAVERELDRIEQRNSTRQDFTPAFDRELARKVIMAGFGLFSCRGGTTASGYQWMELLETLGLDKARPVSPAPAVSRDDAIEQIVVGFSDKAILRLDIEEDDPRLSRVCDDMRQTVRAILSRLRGEG
jgi:hypothetical protein